MPHRGSTNPTVNPVRRESLRLKVISAIYQAKEALSSQVQQPSGGSSPCNSNQIKVQSTGFPDDPSINETLKDLRKRCRSKRQKELKSIASSTTGLVHSLLKPKEEELDLEEPLIYLKVKSNKFCTNRKRRKHSHLSESILPVEDISAQTPYPFFSSEEVFSPSPVATDKSSTVTEVATVDGSICIAESVDANLAVTSDEDPLRFGSPDLVYAVKTEIVEDCDAVISSLVFVGNCNTLGESSTEPSQQICEEESVDGESYCSTSKFLHPCVTSQTEMGCHKFSPSTVSQTGTSLLADISQSVNGVNSGVIDIDSLGEAAAYVSSSSDPVHIGKFSDPGNSSGQQHERFVEGVLERGDVSSFTTETLNCCSNEVSFEFMEADSYINLPESGCLKKNLPERGELPDCKDDVSTEFMEADNCISIPERGEENCGEMIELDSSKSSCNKLSPSSKSEMPTLYADSSQLISATTDLISDVYGGASRFNITMEVVGKLTNQIDNLARTDNHEWKSENNTLDARMCKESENGGDEIPAPEIPTCSHENNVPTEHSLLSRDIRDLHHASGFSGGVGSLDSLVLKALCGDARRNSNEDRLNSMSFSSCNSHAGNVSSLGTDSLRSSTVDQAWNQYTERASSFGEIDAEELVNSQIEKSSLVGMCDPCVPQHSHTSFNSVQQLHAAGESSSETGSSHCSTMDQMLNSYSEKEANSAEDDTADIVEALDSHSPKVSPSDSGAVDELLKVEDCSSKACQENQSSAEKMLCKQVDMQTCFSPEMSNLVEGEGCNMENELKCARGMMAEHPPKKLLSNRKEFSPISQEKLCRALNVSELDDMLKTPNQEETEVRLSSGKLTKKSKSSKNGSLQPLSKGILKSPDTSDRNPSCTENSLIHMQAQKAVTFSQRQMQDIETIATNLLKGLSSMKNIVSESMGSEELRAEEIRIAIDDASNLEATTKKWLSMMAKDCSRFCKIMHKSSTENMGGFPVAVRKQPKKITFADEAGGLLCHVKVFEQLPTSFIVPRNDS